MGNNRIKEEKRGELERGFFIRRSYTLVLGLGLAEAAVYAIIRSFSEHFPGGFTGSRAYIASLTGITQRSVTSALSSLVDMGLITRGCEKKGGRLHPTYFSDGSRERELVERYVDEAVRAEDELRRSSNPAPKNGADTEPVSISKPASEPVSAAPEVVSEVVSAAPEAVSLSAPEFRSEPEVLAAQIPDPEAAPEPISAPASPVSASVSAPVVEATEAELAPAPLKRAEATASSSPAHSPSVVSRSSSYCAAASSYSARKERGRGSRSPTDGVRFMSSGEKNYTAEEMLALALRKSYGDEP